MFIFALTTLPHIEQKFFENILVWSGTAQLCFEISLFEQNFYQYVTVYLVRKWTYKNADETAHTFSISKNVKSKERKTDSE